MADGFGYGGSSGVPYPFWLSSPSTHPPASAPPFLASHPVESYDPTQGGFDPMIYQASYHRSPPDWSNNPAYRENSRSHTPSSSFYADNCRPERYVFAGNCGPRGQDSYKDMFAPSGVYSSRESSSDSVPLPTENFSERQRYNLLPTYNSATSAPVSSLAEMLIRNSQEPFYKPIPPSGVYTFSNSLDEKLPGHYHPGYDKPESMNCIPGPPVEPYMCVTDSLPSLPMPVLKTEALFDGSQTGIHLGDGISLPSNDDVCNYGPERSLGVQSSLHGSSIEPVNYDVLLGYGEAAGHFKPLPEAPDLGYRIVGSPGLSSPRSRHPLAFNIKSSSSLYKDKLEGTGATSINQSPNTLVVDSENGVSESSLKNAIEDSNYDEHRSWNHFMVYPEGPSAPTMFSMGSEPCGAIEADIRNAQSAVNYKIPFNCSANQPSEDVQANQKPCKLQERTFDMMNKDKKTSLLTDRGHNGSIKSNADDVSTGRSPEKLLCDQGDFPSTTSSPRVSSVVNAMHNLSEVLVYECFNNGSWLKLEQLENLDKVVDNLTKCLKKITESKTIAGEASVPSQAMNVSSPNLVNLNEAPKGVGKDFQGSDIKPLDSFGFKDPVDKSEMTQSIKNILASNFPDGEENHPQTLLYKNLWLETEAALCSTTCMARFHRVKNELGVHNREISTDATTFMQEPFLKPQISVPITTNVEQGTTDPRIKHGSNGGDNVVTMSHAALQSSRFNSDPVDAVLSLFSRSFTGDLEQNIHGNFTLNAATSGKIPDTIQQKTPAFTTEEKHNDVIDRFQILKQQETKRKLRSQNDQEENQEASEMANIGRSSHVSDVMNRFQILKRREAEQVQKSLNSLNIDSDSDNNEARNKTQMHEDLWLSSMMTRYANPQIDDTEPSASVKGYESPNSDWEHVLKDD